MKTQLPAPAQLSKRARTPHQTTDHRGPLAFDDNRSHAVAQRERQDTMDNSGQAMQLIARSAMINDSRQSLQQKAIADGMNQRRQIVIQSEAGPGPYGGTLQRLKEAEDEEPRQRKQGIGPATAHSTEAANAPNTTGLPDGLKTGMESLSGMSMDRVKVHYNSSRPAQLNALAYTQGTEIHVGPGQEQHLPHETWHVVQQAQGRVRPTMQLAGVAVNDDGGLEAEADVMGASAVSRGAAGIAQRVEDGKQEAGRGPAAQAGFVQRKIGDGGKTLVGRQVRLVVPNIGDGGKALIGHEVIRVADDAIGTIESIPPGMHEYTSDINIFYRISFADGVVDISAQNSRYGLVENARPGVISGFPELQMAEYSNDINLMYEVTVDGKATTVSAANPSYFLLGESVKAEDKPSASPILSEPFKGDEGATSVPVERPEAAQARGENERLRAFQARLGEPLTSLQISFQDPRITVKPQDRKALIAQLGQLTATPDKLIGDKTLQKLEAEVDGMEKQYQEAARQSAIWRAEKDQLKKQSEESERLRLAAEELAKQNAAALKKKNQTRLGGKYGQFQARLNDAEIDSLLGRVSLSEDGKLANVLQYATYTKLHMLLNKATASALNNLLPGLGGGQEDVLAQLLDNILPKQEDDLETLIHQTNDNKTALLNLLTRLNKNAKVAVELMALGGAGHEAGILAMLNQGRSVSEIKGLLGTTSGQGNAPDAATISGGVPAVADATTLLNTAGVKGHAASTLLVLAHAKVNNVVASAESLLNKKGTAADALALLGHAPLSLANAILLMDTTGINGQGADAVLCLGRPTANVPDLIVMLNLRTATELYSYLDPARGGHSFNAVHTGLQNNNAQTFWAGDVSAAPACSGWAGSLNAIIASAVNPPVVGQYAGHRPFGNFGGAMSMLLPDGTAYREYDLAPYVDDPSRGTRRMVVGNNGHRYYTPDHYKNFTRFA